MTCIAWALLGMAGYWSTTLFVKLATRSGEFGAFAVLAISVTAVGIGVWVKAILTHAFAGKTAVDFSRPDALWAYGAGLALFVAVGSLFKGLSLGPASVVVPIYGMFILGGAVLGMVFLHEPVTLRLARAGARRRRRLSGRSMTEPDLDARRRRIRFRAWHRGTREMDLLMGRFADSEVAGLPEAELHDLELLMEAPDRDVFSWLTGEIVTPGNYDTPVFRKVRAFHTHAGPLYR